MVYFFKWEKKKLKRQNTSQNWKNILLVIKLCSFYLFRILDAVSPLDLMLPVLSVWPAALEAILDATSG